MAEGFHIAFMGLIGVGKSTLAENLSQLMGIPLYKEGVDNKELLTLFYDRPEAYAFTLQIDLLADRLQQQHKVTWDASGSIQDRSFYEDLAFAALLTKNHSMKEQDFNAYKKIFHVVMKTMKHPWIVYLKVDPAVALQRIKKRGRKMEQGIDLQYLQDLDREYEILLEHISKQAHVNVIQIPWNDFRQDTEVLQAIRGEMNKHTGIYKCEFESWT